MEFDEKIYEELLEKLFVRFPSFQKVGSDAYKPGLDNMLIFDSLLGHPHKKYKTIHIAGTNGKGSVSNMLASVLATMGYRTGLYTSPHILDFRERMRIIDPVGIAAENPSENPSLPAATNPAETSAPRLIPKPAVFDFITRWSDTFDYLSLSFFEITTMMAFDWFDREKVDIAVIETGLGGRLDSTNIITPVLSVITNIGLDHCDILGSTLPEIAYEKAGIIKPSIPVVVGESSPETDPVFEHKVLYTNLSDPALMGDRAKIMSLLTFADKTAPPLLTRHETILAQMDLQGSYQRINLRTCLTAIRVLADADASFPSLADANTVSSLTDALIHTASRTGFHGRWEKLLTDPMVIADIGHNAHGLRYNFAQLSQMLEDGRYDHLLMVFGMVGDKDVEAVLDLLPENAEYFFTNASIRRALPAGELLQKYYNVLETKGILPPVAEAYGSVGQAIENALASAEKKEGQSLIYIGGSTFVVAEAVSFFKNLDYEG